jgi:hypothetical protein
MKKRSEYNAIEWARLYPEQRYAAIQAENDAALGLSAIPVRAADGRGVVYIDPVTRAPAATAPARRIGGPI